MSCFNGPIKEYDGVSIDRFDGGNVLSTSFFLSHCHKDHMVGLNSFSFVNLLRSRKNVFLYCSEVTSILLLQDEEYADLKDFVKIMEVDVPQTVIVQSKNQVEVDVFVRVTAISAGHCPGSVMFLFEGENGTCLYTGDFRWELNQGAKAPALRDVNGDVKHIKSLYIDTTFCVIEAYHIPSRNECVEATVTLVSSWLSRSPHHVVNISCPARYGHEHLLAELSRRLDTKIHVYELKVDLYERISGLIDIFTANPTLSRIHACSQKNGHPSSYQLPCGHHPPHEEKYRILNIRPSTMWFTSEKTKATAKDLVVTPATHRGLHRVCYSTHSSYSEIRDLVSYLCPDEVFPNVCPSSDSDLTVVQKRLNNFLSYPHPLRVKMGNEREVESKLLGKLKTVVNNSSLELLKEESSDDLVFSSQDSSNAVPTIARNFSNNKGKEDLNIKLRYPVLTQNSSQSTQSSFQGSENVNADEGSVNSEANCRVQVAKSNHESSVEKEESFQLYVSGDSDVTYDDAELSQDEEFSLYRTRKGQFYVGGEKDFSNDKESCEINNHKPVRTCHSPVCGTGQNIPSSDVLTLKKSVTNLFHQQSSSEITSLDASRIEPCNVEHCPKSSYASPVKRKRKSSHSVDSESKKKKAVEFQTSYKNIENTVEYDVQNIFLERYHDNDIGNKSSGLEKTDTKSSDNNSSGDFSDNEIIPNSQDQVINCVKVLFTGKNGKDFNSGTSHITSDPSINSVSSDNAVANNNEIFIDITASKEKHLNSENTHIRKCDCSVVPMTSIKSDVGILDEEEHTMNNGEKVQLLIATPEQSCEKGEDDVQEKLEEIIGEKESSVDFVKDDTAIVMKNVCVDDSAKREKQEKRVVEIVNAETSSSQGYFKQSSGKCKEEIEERVTQFRNLSTKLPFGLRTHDLTEYEREKDDDNIEFLKADMSGLSHNISKHDSRKVEGKEEDDIVFLDVEETRLTQDLVSQGWTSKQHKRRLSKGLSKPPDKNSLKRREYKSSEKHSQMERNTDVGKGNVIDLTDDG